MSQQFTCTGCPRRFHCICSYVLLLVNGREMSCTPDLGEMTTAPSAICSILVLIDYGSFFCFVFYGRHFSQQRGQAKCSREQRERCQLHFVRAAKARTTQCPCWVSMMFWILSRILSLLRSHVETFP
jgi:hypothetical protein